MSEQIFFCGAPTREGGKCKNKVAADGLRCYVKSHQAGQAVEQPAAEPVTPPPVVVAPPVTAEPAVPPVVAAPPVQSPAAADATATPIAVVVKPPTPPANSRKKQFRGKGMTWDEAKKNGFIRPIPVLELVTHEDPDLDALACLWLAQEKQPEVLVKLQLEGGKTTRRFTRDEVPPEPGKRLVFDIGDGNTAAGVFSNHPVAAFPGQSSLDLFWDWLGLSEWSAGVAAIRETVRLHDTKGQYLQGLRQVSIKQLHKQSPRREARVIELQLKEWRESHLIYLLRGLNQHFRRQPEMVAKLVGRVFSAIATSEPTADDVKAARLVLDRCLALWVLQQYLHRRYPWSPTVELEPQVEGEALLVCLDRQLLQVKLGRQTVADKLAQQEHRGAPGVHSRRIMALLGVSVREHYYDQHLVSLEGLAERINRAEPLSPPATGEVGGQKFTVTDWEQRFILVNMVAALLRHTSLTGQEVLEVVFAFYDALAALGKDYQQAIADYQAGKRYQLPVVLDNGQKYGLHVGVFHSSTRQIGEYARSPEQSCQLVLVRTHDGYTYLQLDKRLRLGLQGVIKALRVREAEQRSECRPVDDQLTAEKCPLEVWYYHAGRIMNGSLKRAAVPTVLSLQEIEDCVREGLAVPRS